MYTTMDIVWLLVFFGLAGLLQGAVGFGFGLVAVALLSLVFDIRAASIMLAPASLAMNLYILVRLRGHLALARVVPMLVATVLGVPLGVWFLLRANPVVLHRVLGAILLIVVIQGLVPMLARKRWHPVYLGVPCGLFSGMMAGAFASGGPPAVAYVVSQRFDRYRYAATLQVVFATSAIIRIVLLGFGGIFTRQSLALAAAGTVCAIAGAWGGLHLLRLQSDRRVKACVLVLLALLATKFLFF